MEKTKHQDHKSHGKAHHRPRDAFQLYELEHRLHIMDKLPTLPPPKSPEPVRHNKFWNNARYGGGTTPVYDQEVDDTNDEADEFIAAERKKFKLNRQMSSSSSANYDQEGSERFPDLSDNRDPDAWTCMYGPCNYQWLGYPPHY